MSDRPRSAEPLVFGCRNGFSAVLGSFDGRDRRTLMTHLVPDRPAQLLVSMHEQLHEELHWSTAWGVTSAMAGLLAGAGIRGDDLSAVAMTMNTVCREVHERFATTISSGAVGVPAAQVLLAGNPLYLGYLNDGLALGGPSDRWPWQFRESAVQMLLRVLMQPAELAGVAERGFSGLVLADIASETIHPDARLGCGTRPGTGGPRPSPTCWTPIRSGAATLAASGSGTCPRTRMRWSS